MSVNSKMTAIANKIRTLLGITGVMSLDAMESNLGTAVSEVDEQVVLIQQIKTALEGKTAVGNGGTTLTIGTATKKLSSNSTTITFEGLTGEPKMFAIVPTGNITLGSTRYVTGVMYDGSRTHGTYGYRQSSSATSYYSASYFTWTYSNGTLTVKTSSSTNGGNFSSSATYQLVYVA